MHQIISRQIAIEAEHRKHEEKQFPMQESVAVTQNFVSSVGLRQCLAFLKTGNPELVSGCLPGKRTGLHDVFLAALQINVPEVRLSASPTYVLLRNLGLDCKGLLQV